MSELDDYISKLREWGKQSSDANAAFMKANNAVALDGLMRKFVDRSIALRNAWQSLDTDGGDADMYVWDTAFAFSCAAVAIADELCRRKEFGP